MALEWINVFDLVDAADITVSGAAEKDEANKRLFIDNTFAGIESANYNGASPCTAFSSPIGSGLQINNGGSLTLPSGYVYSGRVQATVEASTAGADGGYGLFVYATLAFNEDTNPAGPTVFIEDEACVDEGLTIYLHFGTGLEFGSGLFAVKFEVEAEPAEPPEFWTDLVSVRALT